MYARVDSVETLLLGEAEPKKLEHWFFICYTSPMDVEQKVYTHVVEQGKQWYIIQRTDDFFYITRQEAREEIERDEDGHSLKKIKYLDIADGITEQFEEDMTCPQRDKLKHSGMRGQVQIQAFNIPFEEWFDDTIALNKECDIRLTRMFLKKTRPNIGFSNEDKIEPMECTLVFGDIKFTFN